VARASSQPFGLTSLDRSPLRQRFILIVIVIVILVFLPFTLTSLDQP
jgi:hypothetical protein